MKFILPAIVVFVMLCATRAFSGEWERVTQTPDGTTIYLARGTILAKGDGLLKASLKHVYQHCTIKEAVFLYEIDCPAQKSRVLSVRQTYASEADQKEYGGEVVKENPKWKPMDKNSSEFGILNGLCGTRVSQ